MSTFNLDNLVKEWEGRRRRLQTECIDMSELIAANQVIIEAIGEMIRDLKRLRLKKEVK